MRSAGDAPLLIVASFRDTERPDDLVDLLAQLRREHVFESIVLRGLAEADAAEMMASLGRQELSGSDSRALWEETRGNPFFLEEMLRHLESRGAGERELPEGIREVIGRRLAALSEPTSQALTTAAVIGREFTLDLLGAVGPHSEDELDEVVEESVAANVIAEVPSVYGRCSFTHSLIRQALYEGLTVTRRARLHLRIAEALEHADGGRPQSLAELAHHYFLAPPARGSDKAVDYAEQAARDALGVLAYEEAARLYGIALEALDRTEGDPRRRCKLLLALGGAQTKAGEAAAARVTFRDAGALARSLSSPELLAQAALGYGAAGQMTGGLVDATVVELLEEALTALGERDSALRVRLLARLAIELAFSEQRRRREDVSSEALAMARRMEDVRGLGFALGARHWSLWGPGNVDERLATANDLLRLADRAGDERLAMQGHRWRMIDVLELGDMDAVDTEIEAYARIAAGRRRLSEAMYVHLFRAMRMLMAGEFRDAEPVIREVGRIGERVQNPNGTQAYVEQMVALLRERGGLEQIEDTVRDHAERYRTIPGWRCVLAHVHAEIGASQAAKATLDAFGADGFRGVPLDGIWLGAMSYLAEAAAVIGDPTHAEALYDLLEPFADRNVAIGWATTCSGSASRHLGELAALLGRTEQAIGHLESALAMNERMRARPWVAHTKVELARVLADGDAARAATLLDEAAAEARVLGMPRLLEVAAGLRGPSVGSRP
jgi:tetratricopeptide (TPR) repeat protein